MSTTKARKKKFRRGMAVYLPAYFATVFATHLYVQHHRPEGTALYVCAALPWLALCGGIAGIAKYLYEERDGYSRELAMRCLLWGAAGAMATNCFVMSLRQFGWRGQAPALLEICVFAAASLVARIAYSVSNRPERGSTDGVER